MWNFLIPFSLLILYTFSFLKYTGWTEGRVHFLFMLIVVKGYYLVSAVLRTIKLM